MVALILDTIIPADNELGMPSAAMIDFEAYVQRYCIQEPVSRYTLLVEAVAQEKLGRPFDMLETEERLAVVNATRTKDIRLFSFFLTHVFRAYYSHRDILQRIGSGAVPPFPDGNRLEPDDWDLLEPVYERGPIFRVVEEAES